MAPPDAAPGMRRHAGGAYSDNVPETHQQPQPHPLLLPQPMELPPHPQKSRRMIIQQQLSPPPKPLRPLPQPLPQPFPQQARRRRIQIQEIPLFPSHPHPQFVAAKSLISFSSEKIVYSVGYAAADGVLLFFTGNALPGRVSRRLCGSEISGYNGWISCTPGQKLSGNEAAWYDRIKPHRKEWDRWIG